MEVVLDVVGYGSLIALPMGHKAAEEALAHAATRGAMVALKAPDLQVRAARLRTLVGKLDRTLIVVESQELLEGQKRGVAARLEIAKQELRTLQRQAAAGKMTRPRVVERLRAILAREHLYASSTRGWAGPRASRRWSFRSTPPSGENWNGNDWGDEFSTPISMRGARS